MSLVRVCNVPDHAGTGSVCKWPDPNVGIALMQVPPGVSEAGFSQAVDWVIEQWNTACGVKMAWAAQAFKARILIYTRKIDGPAGVLAESELPCGPVKQCKQWYDSSEKWDVRWPPTGDGISLYLTLLHEVGHAIGISHAPDGTVAVMAAFLNSSLRALQPWDIAQGQRRYGKPVGGAPGPTGGTNMNRDEIVKRIESILLILEHLAKLTNNKVDDALIGVAKDLLKQTWLIDILLFLFQQQQQQQQAAGTSESS